MDTRRLRFLVDCNLAPAHFDPTFEATRLWSSAWSLAVPQPVRGRDFAADADAAWIVNSRYTADEEVVRTVAALVGFEPRVEYRVDGLLLVQDLIAAGLGVALLPADQPVRPGLELLPLRDPEVVMRSYAVVRRGRAGWPPLTLILRLLQMALRRRCGERQGGRVFREPATDLHESFLAAMAEFQAEGRGGPDDGSMIGYEIRTFAPDWTDPAAFAHYVAELRAQALADTPRPAEHVPCTTLWWTDDDGYVGRLAIRHRLNERLLEMGGHIGYDVKASARRRGHATEMLRAALPIARDLGIERVLVTCDADNNASRRVIENNGGAREDQRGDKLRFWLPTSASTGTTSPSTPGPTAG